jgi:hypothetical protein
MAEAVDPVQALPIDIAYSKLAGMNCPSFNKNVLVVTDVLLHLQPPELT